MNNIKLLQTNGLSPNETGNTISCKWTLFINGHPIKTFNEYTEAIREYKNFYMKTEVYTD
jgi:hypothetical protein